MPSLKTVVVKELRDKGFGIKITDGGVIAHLGSRKPSRHEIVDAVPQLEGLPMETVEDGVFIQVGEKGFAI